MEHDIYGIAEAAKYISGTILGLAFMIFTFFMFGGYVRTRSETTERGVTKKKVNEYELPRD